MGIEDRSEEGEDPIKVFRTRKWQSRCVSAQFLNGFTTAESWTLLRMRDKTEVWDGADCVSIAGWQLCDK
jgi:hypothetical protein